MRIDQITVQNFRCFENLILDLHPECNVLIGENGSGKTALLDALAVIASDWPGNFPGFSPRYIDGSDYRSVWRRVGDETLYEVQTPLSVYAKGFIEEHQTTWKRGSDRSDGSFKAVVQEVARCVQEGEGVTLPIIAYYPVERASKKGEDEGNYSPPIPLTQRELSRLEGYRDAMEARTRAYEFTRWIAYQELVAYQEGHKSPVYQAVLNAMPSMVEDACDVRFDARRLEIVIEFEKGEIHPFAHLSDGQRNMLAMTGDIAMRMARLNPQFSADVLTQTPGVVLIDELDLHLHPRWQRHVVADLRRTFPKVQFITTTHSPQIISEVQPESVIVLAKEGDNMVAYKAHQAYGLDTNGVLMRLMDTRTRPADAQKKIDAVDNAIEEGDLNEARHLVGDLRQMLHGEDPEVIRLDTSIYALEALADAVD